MHDARAKGQGAKIPSLKRPFGRTSIVDAFMRVTTHGIV
jgi:hypothetical protein